MWAAYPSMLIWDMRIFACLASTIDGKIGPARVDHFVPITSPYDMEHLKTLRDKADGILFGAGTFRAWPKVHSGKNPRHLAHHFILSRSLQLDFQTPLFQQADLAITLVTGMETRSPKDLPVHVQILRISDASSSMKELVDQLELQGVKTLLIEGGGQVLYQFIEAGLLQELYLTLSPQIMGDDQAPALLADMALSNPPRLSIHEQKVVGNEVYLKLGLHYTQT